MKNGWSRCCQSLRSCSLSTLHTLSHMEVLMESFTSPMSIHLMWTSTPWASILDACRDRSFTPFKVALKTRTCTPNPLSVLQTALASKRSAGQTGVPAFWKERLPLLNTKQPSLVERLALGNPPPSVPCPVFSPTVIAVPRQLFGFEHVSGTAGTNTTWMMCTTKAY